MLITNTEPKSYVSVGTLRINDQKGNLFYYFPGPGLHHFNLPYGIYTIVEPAIVFPLNKFTPDPQIEDCMHISTAYRGMDITVQENPNKASFFPHSNSCTIDDRIANLEYEPCVIGCLNHEEGHTDIRSGPGYSLPFLTAEHYCDCYSYNKMVKNGYNSSQAQLAFHLLLGLDMEDPDYPNINTLNENHPRIIMLDRKIAIANTNKLPVASLFESFNLPEIEA